MTTMLDAPADTLLGRRDRSLFETMYSAGLLVSDLVGINVDDMDVDGGTLVVRGKGKLERVALLGRPAIKSMREWLESRDGLVAGMPAPPDAVFLNRFGRPV